MAARWGIVLVTAAAVVVTPQAIASRPTANSTLSAVQLAERIQFSADVAWSGFVESSGTVKVPDSDSFATLGQLLGEHNQLRVWWRSETDWRVDRIRSTGETDLFRRANYLARWVFESERVTFSPVSAIRLPDASDVLPPTLARALLQGARTDELDRLPVRRVAGVEAPGLRLTPDEAAATVTHVDVWAEPGSGLPLRVELYGADARRPVLTTTLVDLSLAIPDPSITHFIPAVGVSIRYDESVDVAAAANAFAPYDLPESLGGLDSRTGDDPDAVGIYGRGPTTLMVLPLRGQVARPLRERLRASAASRETDAGTLLTVGPVGVLMTPSRGHGGGFLLAGTVTPEALERAASDLPARQ